MNNRELFNNIMHYRNFDRMPVLHWYQWEETEERWHKEGLPSGIKKNEDIAKYLGASEAYYPVGINLAPYPAFEERVIEETPEYKIFRQEDGVIAKHSKGHSSIPHLIDYTLKGTEGEGWDEYKKRLQPDMGRFPANFDEIIAKAKDADSPVSVYVGSLIGWIRNWVGVENLAYISYDNRDLLKEMSDTITDLVLWNLDIILPKLKPDIVNGWEDICCKSGPLISPAIFKEICVPNYERIARKIHSYGIELYAVDCDGVIDSLLPLWLDAGVNVMFPCEIGTWKADPMAYRKKYGKKLRIYGGMNKGELAKGRAAIDAEIERKLPMMKEGGFVPLTDHYIPPDVSLDDYKYYLDKIRSIRI